MARRAFASTLSTGSSAISSSHGYVEVKAIGKGSFGKATLVRSSDGRLCVMKTVDIGQLDRSQRKAAAAEVTVLASLKHPYIVRYYESFLDSNTLAIVMEYAEGGDLSQRIEVCRNTQRKFPESQVLRWLTQAVLGLKHLHGRNILHRDLKPQNLFLTKQDQLKIGDFGISKDLDKNARNDKELMGTPYYMSPEVCTEALYSFASDIWALGCVLYELCALRVPFDSTSFQGLVQRMTRESAPGLPEQYSRELAMLGRTLLERKHTQRPDTEAIIQNRLIQKEITRMLQEESADASVEVSRPSSQAETVSTAVSCSRPLSRHRSVGVLGNPTPNGRCDVLRHSGSAALLVSNPPPSKKASEHGERRTSGVDFVPFKLEPPVTCAAPPVLLGRVGFSGHAAAQCGREAPAQPGRDSSSGRPALNPQKPLTSVGPLTSTRRRSDPVRGLGAGAAFGGVPAARDGFATLRQRVL